VAADKDVVILRTFSEDFWLRGAAHGRGVGASRLAGEGLRIQQHHDADHRHGGGQRQLAGEVPGPGAPQIYRGRA